MYNLSQVTCNLTRNILIGRSPWAGKPFDLPSNIWAAHTETHIPLWPLSPCIHPLFLPFIIRFSFLARHMTAQLDLYSPILSYYLVWPDDQVIANGMQAEVVYMTSLKGNCLLSSCLWTGMWVWWGVSFGHAGEDKPWGESRTTDRRNMRPWVTLWNTASYSLWLLFYFLTIMWER